MKKDNETAEQRRRGIVVKPYCRLTDGQVKLIDSTSKILLEDPGLLCYNRQAAEIFKTAGAKVEDAGQCRRLRIPPSVIEKAVKNAPSKIVLGAPNPENKLVLDAAEPRVHFGTGSETNTWLDVKFDNGQPVLTKQEGSIERLCKAAHLCENLNNVDFFIRCVNIRDEEINAENKDVNIFLASMNNISKHFEAGLVSLDALDDIERMGHIIAGGKDAFEKEPPLSLITCFIKSPFQIVNDTTTKLIEIVKRRIPLIVSCCPMGGATGPFDEFAMLAQVNAEVLTGVALSQLVCPGAPVLYGALPIRTRLDNLNDMYGAPQFNHYNCSVAQMARFYNLPIYSSAVIADADVPGIQATAEKMLTLVGVPAAGAQYIHNAFGLLGRSDIFCPEQAVIDNAHIGLVKMTLKERAEAICEEKQDEVLNQIRDVMHTDHKTYMYHLPMPTKSEVYVSYPLEDKDNGALYAAHQEYRKIMDKPRNHLPPEVLDEIKSKVRGILPKTLAC